MIEIIALGVLVAINIVIIGFHAYYVHETSKERKHMLNALVSRNSDQLRDLEMASKVEPIKVNPAAPPDFIPVTELDEEEFDEKVIGKEIA